jgi:hypothetical protein
MIRDRPDGSSFVGSAIADLFLRRWKRSAIADPAKSYEVRGWKPSTTIGAGTMDELDAGRAPEQIATCALKDLTPPVMEPTMSVARTIVVIAAVGVLYGVGSVATDSLWHGAGPWTAAALSQSITMAAACWLSGSAFVALTARHPGRRKYHWAMALLLGVNLTWVVLRDRFSPNPLENLITKLPVAFIGSIVASLMFFLVFEIRHSSNKPAGGPTPADDLYDPRLDGRP